jgi:acetylornithine deacetylase/succinyl-diaminopimelate desuccinylase-like protein
MTETAATLQSMATTARSRGFVEWLGDSLLQMCRIDTTPRQDVAGLAADESRCFDLIEHHLKQIHMPGLISRRPEIDPAIEHHRFYSNPKYACSDGHVPPAKSVYHNRHNLLAMVDGAEAAPGLALNVHVDVVHPYVPPRQQGGTIFGRGACDDKGPLMALVGAMRLVSDHLKAHGQRLAKPLTLMFVIDEESGGNGSLSAAIDRSLKQLYDTVFVLECCSSRIHPGNRGAVWYQVSGEIPGVNMLEASAFVVEEMETTGRAIKAESRHALFPHRPVQTCHGILGPFGEHPSRICGRVEFTIARADGAWINQPARVLLEDLLASGLNAYIGLYGDKTQVLDPATRRPKVERHFELTKQGPALCVRVLGSTGHMGSILENDGAITKAASMLRALVRSRRAFEDAAEGRLELRLNGWDHTSRLSMEGGQGFLPTHAMEDVQDRLRDAVWRGVERYLRLMGKEDMISQVPTLINVSYDKLHNAAFAGDPESAAMSDAIEAARQAGIWDDAPVRGWDVSCDARLFACEYPDDLVVLTGGPGHLRHAHADDEQIEIDEVASFAHCLARFVLQRCGVKPTHETADRAQRR